MKILKVAGTLLIRERCEIKGKNELLGKRVSLQALVRVWPRSGPCEADPNSGGSSGAPRPEPGRVTLSPVPVRRGVGAASPAPFFQISRFAPKPSPTHPTPSSAHCSAGGSASSRKLFSISSSRSPSCSRSPSRSIPTAETANGRPVKSEPGSNTIKEKKGGLARRRAHALTRRVLK